MTAPPAVRDSRLGHNVVDQFLLAALEAKGLRFSPPASRETLLRRLTLDLTGLPPTPDETEAFIADDASDAYDRLLERLLASPEFGERWGRYWLDWSGYVDVLGGDNDAGTVKLGEGKWRYRDYVVHSFARDKPFHQFLREQMAGDEMVDWRGAKEFTPEMVELLTATTFLRSTADDTDEHELNTMDIRHGVLQRTAEVVANNLLALTLHCAKCHDHKYDPLSQRDYYRFLAFFTPAFNPDAWLQPTNRALPDVAVAERDAIVRHNQSIDESLRAFRERRAALEEPVRSRLLEAKLARLPEEIRDDTRRALQTKPEQRDPAQKYLAEKFEKSLRPTTGELETALSASERAAVDGIADETNRLHLTRRSWGWLQAVYDVGPPPATRLLKRGDYLNPGEEVQPAFPSILFASGSSRGDATALVGESAPVGTTSGRRLALARWLTDSNSLGGQLVARVFVNRVWQQLFGVGLVETSDNFGLSGTRPSHPELLDWLATSLLRHEWRLKPLLREILNSAAYQQSSAPPGTSETVRAQGLDPENTLLWRQRLRRLEAEAIRDSLLAVSGQLNRTRGGPAVPLESRPDGMVVVKRSGNPSAAPGARRSLYLLARRNYHLSLLSTFDQPAMPLNCSRRTTSAVVAQSLTMLNDEFVLEQARLLAIRAAQGVSPDSLGPDSERVIERAFLLALARAPDAEESAWCVDHIRRQQSHYERTGATAADARQRAWTSLCHTLLNSSEFLYTP